MEAFEMFVALALESEKLVVSSALKFPVELETSSGRQTHGFEVDLVGANRERLVLASVKSFLGSYGVHADHVKADPKTAKYNKRYALLNNPVVRSTVVSEAAERFGYDESQVELRLYVGKFYGADGKHEALIREWCAGEIVGGGPIGVWNLHEIVAIVRELAKETQYRDNPALVAVKVLLAADGARQA